MFPKPNLKHITLSRQTVSANRVKSYCLQGGGDHYRVKTSMVAWSNFVLFRTFFSLLSLSGDIMEPGGGEDIDVVGLSRREDEVSCLDSETSALSSPPVWTTKGAPGGGSRAGVGVFGGFFFL